MAVWCQIETSDETVRLFLEQASPSFVGGVQSGCVPVVELDGRLFSDVRTVVQSSILWSAERSVCELLLAQSPGSQTPGPAGSA